ncbi:cytochrome c1 [Permianibacter sp. IMCC34836]|nr:cytochrome c1 [Permianibacter fluminis]NQD39048.1 cytochrome c1 [Permianibacter fluminis]
MKKITSLFVSLVASAGLLAGAAFASGGEEHLEHANIQPDNLKSLQNGAALYVNYCLGCHSLEHQRYQRMATDLHFDTDVVIQNLMFTGDKIGEQMKIAMRKDDAAKWFGTPPPDLTLVARSRGADWIYTYLKGFYKDDKRPYGVNNTVFPNVGMPHVLQSLQGLQTRTDEGHLELATPGKLNAEEYDNTVRDLVNFLNYVGEPIKAERRFVGVFVVLFLLFFFGVAYLLKKEYWKDVHGDDH